jgi:hypothetical protein
MINENTISTPRYIPPVAKTLSLPFCLNAIITCMIKAGKSRYHSFRIIASEISAIAIYMRIVVRYFI